MLAYSQEQGGESRLKIPQGSGQFPTTAPVHPSLHLETAAAPLAPAHLSTRAKAATAKE